MLLLLVCSSSFALSLETPAPEPEKESDAAASSAVLVTTMLVESSVPWEPLEPIIVEANIEIEPPMGERTKAEEESPEISTGKLI
jgi:hypothetical protein